MKHVIALLGFVRNLFVDAIISFVGVLISIALFVTFADLPISGNVSLQVFTALVALQLSRFVGFAKNRL